MLFGPGAKNARAAGFSGLVKQRRATATAVDIQRAVISGEPFMTILRKAIATGLLAIGAGYFASATAAPCLTNGTDAVGAPVFAATVNTFVGLGINPNTTCIENGLWTDPSGFNLGSYVKGASANGAGIDNSVLGSYGSYGGSLAQAANGRDHAWVQNTAPNANPGGAVGSAPSQGIVWDLGGQANQLAVFVFVDHGPVPGEVLENTVWLSNDANAADADWTQATLAHVYGDGWVTGSVVSDGFVAVYQLANQATFRFASVTWGGPGAIVRDGDNEIDAVGGLNVRGGGLQSVPEPTSLALVGLALAAACLRRRQPK